MLLGYCDFVCLVIFEPIDFPFQFGWTRQTQGVQKHFDYRVSHRWEFFLVLKNFGCRGNGGLGGALAKSLSGPQVQLVLLARNALKLNDVQKGKQ